MSHKKEVVKLYLSEDDIENLSINKPDELIGLIESNQLNIATLSFAVEYLGDVCSVETAEKVLLPLLKHPSGIVREGVLYGLSKHITATIKSAIEILVKSDKSPAIRSIAKDILDY